MRIVLIFLFISFHSWGQVVINAPIKGSGYSAEAQAIFDDMTTNGSTPDTKHKDAIDGFVTTLTGNSNAGGTYWSQIDLIQVYAAENETQALTAWKGSDPSKVSTPTFLADEGFISPSGDHTKYVTTNWNPDDGTNFTQNDAAWWVASTGAGTSNLRVAFGLVYVNGEDGGSGDPSIYLSLDADGNDQIFATLYSENAMNITGETTDLAGFYQMERTSSTAVELFRDASSLGTASHASLPVASWPYDIQTIGLSVDGSPTNNREHDQGYIQIIMFGASGMDETIIYNAWDQYLTDIE